MVRALTLDEFVPFYKEHIVRDFVPAERRPLFIIRRLYGKNRYTCRVLEGENGPLAYACLLYDEGIEAALLDYFAVMPGSRGTGVGSEFLQQLRQSWPAAGVVIESEMPQSENSPEEMAVRKRRLAFYQRGGAQLCPWGWHSFGVEYNLLWLPIRYGLEQADVPGDVQKLYGLTRPGGLLKRCTRLYPLPQGGAGG